MDRQALIGLVEKKHHFQVDPNDPVFVLATISELMLAAEKTEFQRIMTSTLDQVSAANVQAETAARAKAEAIVTKAREWAADRIRLAGETAAARIQADLGKAEAEAQAIGRRLKWAVIAAVVCSAAALSATASTVVAMWTG